MLTEPHSGAPIGVNAGDGDSLADITLARKLLKYDPTVGFDEGLSRTVVYYRDLAKK